MFYRMTLQSAAVPNEVVARLRAITLPATGPLWNWRHLFTWDGRRPPEFAGRVSDDSFRLQYLSPFMGISARPLIDGEIVREGSSTRLRLRLRAIGIDWIMLVVISAAILQAIAEEGLTVEILVALLLLLSFGAGWWLVGVKRVRTVFEKIAPAAIE
jgi:hypothetical protein